MFVLLGHIQPSNRTIFFRTPCRNIGHPQSLDLQLQSIMRARAHTGEILRAASHLVFELEGAWKISPDSCIKIPQQVILSVHIFAFPL